MLPLVLACGVLLSCGGPRRDAPTPDPAPVVPMTHPGTITFVDLDAGTQDTRPADQVPDSIAWGETGAGRVPVVRVESRMRGEAREILRYDAQGGLVDTIVSGGR